MDVAGMDPRVAAVAQYFEYEHLTRDDLKEISKHCHDLAEYMIQTLPVNDMLIAGLWDLLRAKDCSVRSAL